MSAYLLEADKVDIEKALRHISNGATKQRAIAKVIASTADPARKVHLRDILPGALPKSTATKKVGTSPRKRKLKARISPDVMADAWQHMLYHLTISPDSVGA